MSLILKLLSENIVALVIQLQDLMRFVHKLVNELRVGVKKIQRESIVWICQLALEKRILV